MCSFTVQTSWWTFVPNVLSPCDCFGPEMREQIRCQHHTPGYSTSVQFLLSDTPFCSGVSASIWFHFEWENHRILGCRTLFRCPIVSLDELTKLLLHEWLVFLRLQNIAFIIYFIIYYSKNHFVQSSTNTAEYLSLPSDFTCMSPQTSMCTISSTSVLRFDFFGKGACALFSTSKVSQVLIFFYFYPHYRTFLHAFLQVHFI